MGPSAADLCTLGHLSCRTAVSGIQGHRPLPHPNAPHVRPEKSDHLLYPSFLLLPLMPPAPATMKVILLLPLISCCLAAPAPQLPYEYGVNDGYSGANLQQQEIMWQRSCDTGRSSCGKDHVIQATRHVAQIM